MSVKVPNRQIFTSLIIIITYSAAHYILPILPGKKLSEYTHTEGGGGWGGKNSSKAATP
jgi:hypothetical protein